MAKGKKSSKPEVGSPEISPTKAIEFLERQLKSGDELLSKQRVESDQYSTWTMLTRNYLEKAFGKNSPNVTSVMSVGRYGSFPMDADDGWWAAHRFDSLKTQLTKIRGLIELLEAERELQAGESVSSPMSHEPRNHRIFLVHGHDERALHETARFLEKLNQEVLVLREQPNQGRTIVEKFEDFGDVGFAVVLLTADDWGASVSEDQASRTPRARQNVIFELGYFNGRLGRNRVCALYIEGVEIPSDYAGVLYLKMDREGAWRLQLARELRAAGFPIDMNDAL